MGRFFARIENTPIYPLTFHRNASVAFIAPLIS